MEILLCFISLSFAMKGMDEVSIRLYQPGEQTPKRNVFTDGLSSGRGFVVKACDHFLMLPSVSYSTGMVFVLLII